MIKKIVYLIFIVNCSFKVYSRPLAISDKRLDNPPPRIIRTCCSFGVDVKLGPLPFVKYSDISGPELIGPHKYLGNKQEGNGIIYTLKGGFVDIGHLRDQADWTAYLYTLIQKNLEGGNRSFSIKLGYEGGPKVLRVSLPSFLEEEDFMIIAGRIAYDLSVWHEIGTWNGTSLIPLLPERYSAFSVEDGYSNLLGVKLGIQALKSELSYEEAMTQLIREQLHFLEALPGKEKTYDAMMSVEGDWWSQYKKLPNARVIKKREFNIYPCVEAVLLPQYQKAKQDAFPLCLPDLPLKGDVNKYYRIEIQLNNKFPLKYIFANKNKQLITQRDFPILIKYAAYENQIKYADMQYKEHRPKNKPKKKELKKV